MDVPAQLPAGYRLRAPRPDEVSRVKLLTDESDAALGSAPSLSEDMIRAFWSRPRFDLETDAWVVEVDTAMVGYAEVWGADPSRLSGFVVVHPAHTGRGIGTVLADRVEDRAAEKAEGDARLFSIVLTQDAAGARLLEARGYTWARRFWNMDIDLGGDLEPPVPPAGVRLRALDPERDLPAAHRVLELAFEDHWDFAPTSFEEFLDRNIRGEAFDPTLWVIAVEGEGLVGVLSGEAHTERGWVNELGVLASHRGRGIATALLRESFLRFRDRGLPQARLNVDSENPTGAVGLYERVGMHAVVSYDLWAHAIEARQSGEEGPSAGKPPD